MRSLLIGLILLAFGARADIVQTGNIDFIGRITIRENFVATIKYNASVCGYSQPATWCAGSDIGAWINSAILDAGGANTSIELDPNQKYVWTTKITKPSNVSLDCMGSELDYQSLSGVGIALGVVNGGVSQIGGMKNCTLKNVNGAGGGNTSIAIYSGGDPAGIINRVDALDANDFFTNVSVIGFKYSYTHGNNSWSNDFEFVKLIANYDGIYGPPVKFGTVTSFSITSNVVTVAVVNTFVNGDVINITGLSTGTYLNKVPLTIIAASGTNFTAAFQHTDIGNTSDSGQAFDGFYNAGEPSNIIGGVMSNNLNCGMEVNYEPDQIAIFGTRFDYNTNQAICGGGANADLHGAYIEQSNAPVIKHTTATTAMIINLHGGRIVVTGVGTDTGLIQTSGTSDTVSMYSTLLNSNHAVGDIVYTGGGSNSSQCLFDYTYAPGSTPMTNVTDASSPFCRVSAGFVVLPSSGIPYRAETFAANGEHLDAPSLPAGSKFCNQISYIARTDIAPNAQWCIYHGTGGADTDKFYLGMLGRDGVIQMDANGVLNFANSNLTANSPLYLGASNVLTNVPAAFTVATLPSCVSGIKGSRQHVTDASAPSFLGTLTGGGAVDTPVFCNGTAWVPG